MEGSASSAPNPWRPGSRLARLKASHSFGIVAIMIVVTFVFTSAAPSESWAKSVLVLLQCSTLILALWTTGLGRDRRAVSALVAIGLTVAIVQLLVGGTTLIGIVGILNMLLVATTIVVIALGVIDQGAVNRQSITGAVCIYLLLGIGFTFIYGAVAALGPSTFFAQGTDGTPSLQLYFSYVTLATLGYGDYTPATTLGHTLAVTEALLGQLYLVTVVALLVGNLSHQRAQRP
ncbi:MAG: ion channel [Gaiellaceae bacterium]